MAATSTSTEKAFRASVTLKEEREGRGRGEDEGEGGDKGVKGEEVFRVLRGICDKMSTLEVFK